VRNAPFFCHLQTVGAVKPEAVIVISLSLSKDRFFNNAAGTVIEFSYHRYHLLSVIYYTPKGV